MEYLGISIDLERDSLISQEGLELLKKFYLLKTETSPQQAFARAATCYCFGDYDFAQRIYDYVSKLWFMYASPVLSNSTEVEWKKLPKYRWDDSDASEMYNGKVQSYLLKRARGLPISCFLTTVSDDLHGLIDHSAELRWMSVKGGGVGAAWNDVRAVSKKAPGPIPFLKTVDADMTAYHQGETRRGSYAAYMDVSHPDIEEFIQFRKPTGGDANRKCLNLHNAVNFGDKFLDAVSKNSDWDLIDPNDKSVRSTVKARELWELILETRDRTGEPYLHYIDESNRKLPFWLKDQGLRVNGSNLCSEITLPTNAARSAVCCLSSVNAEYYDEWKTTPMVQDLIRFLDNVLEYFILCAPDELRKSRESAKAERSVGLGCLGFHSYLQSLDVAFEGVAAMSINRSMFRNIRKEADTMNQILAAERGSCPDAHRAGVVARLSHVMAIAPNSSSATIANSSPSIEPWSSNAVVRKSRAGNFLVVNKYFLKYAKQYALENDKDQAWIDKQISLVTNDEGSVAKLPWLTNEKKDIFKTATELNPLWIVEHARIRQAFIDQAQSVNLFFKAGSSKALVNKVHRAAFKPADEKGGVPLKTLYYYRTTAIKANDDVSKEVVRVKLADGEVKAPEASACLGCEG